MTDGFSLFLCHLCSQCVPLLGQEEAGRLEKGRTGRAISFLLGDRSWHVLEGASASSSTWSSGSTRTLGGGSLEDGFGRPPRVGSREGIQGRWSLECSSHRILGQEWPTGSQLLSLSPPLWSTKPLLCVGGRGAWGEEQKEGPEDSRVRRKTRTQEGEPGPQFYMS